MKVVEKKNHTNTKKSEYLGQQLGHSKSEGNSKANPFEGKDARVAPDDPTGTGTRHSQASRQQGASPHRVRVKARYEVVSHGGTHTKNATKE
jgi:hypothetical protein